MKISPILMNRITQTQQVIEALKSEGGYATLRRLYEIVNYSGWSTKTPDASVRRIVQESKEIFKIQPGLWALEEARDAVLRKFDLVLGNEKSEEKFSHGYYQGLLVEIGKFQHQTTYVPAQDKNRLFLGKPLKEVAETTDLPQFTYENLLRKAKSVDVIWFNERRMPSNFYEVEHTTDIKNSLSKFYELQDFHAYFHIVADKSRKKEFEDKLDVSMFSPIKNRVDFWDYDKVVGLYTGITQIQKFL